MLAYVIRRIFIGVIMLLVMSLVTFVLFFASPVDPAQFACGKNCSPELREQARKSLGYPPRNQGVWESNIKGPANMWADFTKGIVAGRDFPADKEMREAAPQNVVHCSAPCLGYSQYSVKTVNTMVSAAFPITFSIALAAVILWVLFGVLIGVLAAVTKGSFIDRGIVGLSLFAYAFPAFFIGTFLLRYVAIKWGLVSVPSYTPIASGGPAKWAFNLMLPAITLALLYMASYVRMTRAFVLESLTEDYVRTARAKGVSGRVVLFKHALRAALTPLVTMAGLDFASVLGGAIITESIFNFNGLGKLAVSANNNYDLPVMIGIVLMAGAFVILANIIVDILYAFIDPRVRVG
ncbi:ABC transporter permease [Nocardioides sp. CER19]|uniref:ABC transporter permease n=1 Tax=Nocardioides sp. CER19 TaxID=3038538 RepID=UPI00244BE113|nr:ABC transporter permease [Nocardioides sp. CER19]MDH2416438.1 ABC transporter permease [Nocardioides sp. CER19]